MIAAPVSHAEAFPPGTTWAYRARSKDPLVEVLVVKHGTKRPARVLVRFIDPSFEGREDWVPPARLKAPWADVEAFRAEEARWDAVLSLSPDGDTTETDAAQRVFDLLVPEDVGELRWRDHYLAVRDMQQLASIAGMPVEKLTSHGDVFDDSEKGFIVPWPVALIAAQSLAQRQTDAVADAVDRDEREFQQEAIHGHHYGGRSGEWDVPPERVVADDDEYGKPVRELLRAWCGAEAVSRLDELRALRVEIKRVGEIAEQAIRSLRDHGFPDEAEDLMNTLGQTVGSLRADQSSHRPGG